MSGILKKDDFHKYAVSEVTGTMLLIAVVVIIAAFTAAVAFQLVSSHTLTKNIGMTVTPGTLNNTSPTALITMYGGLDLDRMILMEYSFENGAEWGNITNTDGSELIMGSDYPLAVADVVATGAHDPRGTRLLLRGTFTDGKIQLLFDKTF